MTFAPIETHRLILREIEPHDREAIAVMNADPAVMEFFPKPLTPAETDAMIERVATHVARYGHGLRTLEERPTGNFVGLVGLVSVFEEAPFAPAVEIGWRLATPYWGRGYAEEAARATLEDGFHRLGLDEIVSFTARTNVRSWRLMKRLGMTYDETADFDHPKVPEGHPLRPHVLYRLKRPA